MKSDIVKTWALSRVGNPYVMGATGQPCTPAYRRARAVQYPGSAEKIERYCQRLNGSSSSCTGCAWYDPETGNGKRAYDCAQLTRYAMQSVGISMVSGATSQWKKTAWSRQGEINDLPRDRVCLLYRQDDEKTMGHSGIYLGDGTVIHAKSHAEGVVRETLGMGNRFTHFGIPVGLDEEPPAADQKAPLPDPWQRVREAAAALISALEAAGCE